MKIIIYCILIEVLPLVWAGVKNIRQLRATLTVAAWMSVDILYVRIFI